MYRLAVPADQAGDRYPLLLGLNMVEWLLAIIALLVVAGVGTLAVVLLNRHRASKHEQDLHRDLQEQRQDIERREHRLSEREDRLDAEARQLESRAQEIATHEAEVETKRAELLDIEEERRCTLERIAGLTAQEAHDQLVESIEADAKRAAAITARDIERAAQEEADARAKRILATVIQRLASDQTTESVVSTVQLSGDDMKGRIIGREGRNIRSFEQITGVNLIVDDTPGAVLLSCFDPVRRETARLTLEELVADGRIHPTRIEEVHERSCIEVDRLCVRAGQDAALEMGITDLHPELVATLGKLKYRTSYGQNVLRHLVESGHAAGLLADELGLDRTLCVRGAFLHDIGKALTHEAEGSHAIVGAELARRYGECEDVVHAIEAHHNEVEPRTIEAVITQAADAISGGRPGARRESLEAYVERLHRLEEIAMAKRGVSRVFAMQAGRDVRVMVLPDEVDDIAAQVLARDIAKQFEEELTYPGQIKVTVVRESRATEIAR
ncbi:MAG TPA: ribonuclease Y [Nocardioidaceae bacterium]|nr:ribonuclease Y [Nocardioidaceae bacterium]